MSLSKIIEWILSTGRQFIDARKLAKKFNINTYTAGKILRELRKLGYIEVYRKRKGRFTIYRTNKVNNKYVKTSTNNIGRQHNKST